MPKNVQVDTQKAIRQLTRYADNVRDETVQLIKRTGIQVATKAKKNAPTNTGRLRSSIRTIFNANEPSSTVEVPVFYAPYVEFGTGAYAAEYLSSKSPELRQYAMQFYVSGKGRMPAQPFLFPAWEDVRPEFYKELVRLLQDPRSEIRQRPSASSLNIQFIDIAT